MKLLDTNVCLEVLKGNAMVAARLARHDPMELRLCAIVKAELYYCARASSSVARNLRAADAFCAPFISVPFDDACAVSYGAVRADLRREGRLIGANDLLVASIALAHGISLVTHNLQEFERVQGLTLEDWQGDS